MEQRKKSKKVEVVNRNERSRGRGSGPGQAEHILCAQVEKDQWENGSKVWVGQSALAKRRYPYLQRQEGKKERKEEI